MKTNKTITERINTLKDVLKELKMKELILPFKKPKNPEEKSINAMRIAFLIAKAYNEGTILDWKNSNQPKYLPYKYYSDGAWSVFLDGDWWDLHLCPSGLYFKDRTLCQDAIKKFPEVYNDFLMIQETADSDRAQSVINDDNWKNNHNYPSDLHFLITAASLAIAKRPRILKNLWQDIFERD